MSRVLRHAVTVLTAGLGLCTSTAWAAPAPRGIVSIDAPVVKLRDLFTDAGPKADDVLGPAPAPGQRIDVGAKQLAAIASQYGIAWTSSASDASAVVIERPGTPVTESAVASALRPSLLGAGAPDHFVVQLDTSRLPMIPPGTKPKILVNGIRYDRVNGQFRAVLLVSAESMKPQTFEVPGIAAPAEQVVVTRAMVQPGQVLSINDIAQAWVARASLPQDVLTNPSDALGMQMNRRIAAGTPLSSRVVSRLMLVNRGATVSLAVDMPGLKVTAEGVAMKGGTGGAVIPVLNPSSHEVVKAVIDGHNHAHVVPGSSPTSQGRQGSYYSLMGR